MIAKFGDFEIDTVDCRLSRRGETVHLARQPLDILILLVERAGELVTREEIAKALWGEETFVDAEHGINNAIKKLRAVLGDDSANPRFIETVVRRGYRFKGTIERAARAEAPAVAGAAWPETPEWHSEKSFGRWVIPAGAAAVLIAFAVILLLRADTRPGAAPQLHWTELTRTFRVHTNLPLASDGRFVYWTEYDEMGCRPMQVPVTGGGAAPVRMPFPDAYVLDASRDGHLLLNVRENCKNLDVAGPVWDLDTLGGEARRLGDLLAQAGSYSPDGRAILLARDMELWTAGRNGAGGRRIYQAKGLIYFARWWPDGKRIRFSTATAAPQGDYVLADVEARSGNVSRLFAGQNRSRWGGAWSEAAKGFVYEAQHEGSTDLWRLREPDWFRTRPAFDQLTAGPLDFGSPTAIPGREDLAVVGSRRQGVLEKYDKELRRFVPFLNGISAEMVDFSRDGKWAVWVGFPDGQLWRGKTDGSEALQLTHAPMRAGMPRISPDGRRIAFSATEKGDRFAIRVVPFNGGEARVVTGDGVSAVSPTWSPDGARLLYRADKPGTRIYNDVLEIVYAASGAVATVPNSERKFNQRWSPDGRWIAATPNDESELDLFDFARGQWTVLAKVRADYPCWSADSRYLYFVSGADDGSAGISRVSIGTRRVELIASLASHERAIDDMWGQWSGVTPDGAPLVMMNGDLQQIYLLAFGK